MFSGANVQNGETELLFVRPNSKRMEWESFDEEQESASVTVCEWGSRLMLFYEKVCIHAESKPPWYKVFC